MARNNNGSLGFWRSDPSIGSRLEGGIGHSSSIGSIADLLSSSQLNGQQSYSALLRQVSAALSRGPLDVGKLSQSLDIEPSVLADFLHDAAVGGDITLDKQQDGAITASRK